MAGFEDLLREIEDETALAPTPKDSQKDGLLKIETQLLADSMEIMNGVAAFADINPDAEEPPEQWVRELGREAADRRFRVAKYALCNSKAAPVALSLVQKMALGIIQARRARGDTQNVLNVALVQMSPPKLVYPTVRVGDDD